MGFWLETVRFLKPLDTVERETALESSSITCTVKTLREALKDLDDDYIVFTEGCDCIGEVHGIEVEVDDKSILLCRKPS